MPTFLTTGRMPPELAARVAASVAGRRLGKGTSTASPSRVLARGARVVATVAIAALAAWLWLRHEKAAEALDRERGALLAAPLARTGPLTERNLETPMRVDRWLVEAASQAPLADLVDPTLDHEGALQAVLAAGAVYVRGTVDALKTSAGIADAATQVGHDPFVSCLVSPPASRSPHALLARVHEVYAGHAGPAAASAARLHEVLTGVGFLSPEWRARVMAAGEGELAALERSLDRAPLEEAARGLRARVLVFAVDEPSEGGPTQLDGETPHSVRIGVIDLAEDRVLLRARRRVDPTTVSAEARPLYARGVDSCALAMTVRDELP